LALDRIDQPCVRSVTSSEEAILRQHLWADITVCAFALELRPPAAGSIGTGIGSAGPTPLRAPAAEEFLAGALAESGLWESAGGLPDQLTRRFGELVAAAARPIDDVRGTAAYRRHALSVLARRTLSWAWASYQQDQRRCA